MAKNVLRRQCHNTANAAVELLRLTEQRNRIRNLLEHDREEYEHEQQKAGKLLQEVVNSVQIESEKLECLQRSESEARKMLQDVETRVRRLRTEKIAASLELARLEEETVLAQSRGMEEEADRRRKERKNAERTKEKQTRRENCI